MATQSPAVRSLLLVRNGVDHDARVLRAARVAKRALPGGALVVGVETAMAPAGATVVEGVPVLRLPARTPGLTRVAQGLAGIRSRRHVKPSHVKQTNGFRPASALAISVAPGGVTLAGRARRILSGLSFSRQALAVAHQTRPRLVHANDWNTMWTGLGIKLAYGALLVYDSHELWADRNGRWEWRPWLLASEALFVRAADEVITSSPGYADALARRYRIARPLVVRNIPERCSSAGPVSSDRAPQSDPVPRSDRAPQSDPVPRSDRWPQAHVPKIVRAQVTGPPSPPRVVYVGGLMPGRGLEQMIDALPLLAEVRLYAIGPGPGRYRMDLLARARSARVEDRVVLRAPVAPSEVQSVLCGAAAGLCLIQPICRSYELCLPNKLFEYAAAGLPVLASDAPVIAAVVRGHGLGEVVADSRPRAIAASLERLLARDGWRLAAERARAFAADHAWPDEADTLARVYGGVLHGAANGVARTANGVAP